MTCFGRLNIAIALLIFVSISRAEDVANRTIADRQMAVLRALAAAKLDLIQAVRKVLADEPSGTRAVEAKLVMRGDRPILKLEVLIGEKLKEIDLDGIDGKVISTSVETGTGHGEAEMAEIARKAGVSLIEAIEAASKGSMPGAAVKAQFQLDKGKPACVIDLMNGSTCGSAVIDPATGEVVRVAEMQSPAALWVFDRDKVEAVPPGWRITETNPANGFARWKVVADTAGAEKGQVFALAETSNTKRTYNLAISEKPVFKDLDLEVRMRAISGNEDQGGGPIWRCKDEKNYYICRLNPLESNFRVYCVQDSKRTQLQTADIAAKTGQWYTLRVRMVGPKIECYVNGKKLLEAEDTTFTNAGHVGLWTKADAATMFDELAVKAIFDAKAASRPASSQQSHQ